jgi:hypothetical protein
VGAGGSVALGANQDGLPHRLVIFLLLLLLLLLLHSHKILFFVISRDTYAHIRRAAYIGRDTMIL